MFEDKEKYERRAKKLFKFQIIFINTILVIAIIGTLFFNSVPMKIKIIMILILISLIVIIFFVKKWIYELVFVKLKNKMYRKN